MQYKAQSDGEVMIDSIMESQRKGFETLSRICNSLHIDLERIHVIIIPFIVVLLTGVKLWS